MGATRNAPQAPGHPPSSSVRSLVQLVLSFTFLKWGCFSLSPVSNTATLTLVPYSKKRVESCSEKPLFWIFVYKIHSLLGPTQNTKGPRGKACPQNAHSRDAWGLAEPRPARGTAEDGRHQLLSKTGGHTGSPSGHPSTVTRTRA